MTPDEMLDTVCDACERLARAGRPYNGLIPSLLDRDTGRMLEDKPPAIPGQREGDRSHLGSNLMHDQVLLRTMYALSDALGRADPARGRFRSFLLACLKNFLAEQHRQARRLKRGGGQNPLSWDSQSAEERYRLEPADPVTPEQVYDRRWALTLLETVLARLAGEQSAAGKQEMSARLKGYLWEEVGGMSYAETAAQLNMTESAVKVAVHRLRKRLRDLLRDKVAQTVATGEEIEDELRHLIAAIRG